MKEKSIGVMKIFEFRISMELHILGIRKINKKFVYTKCLSVSSLLCASVCNINFAHFI